MGVDLGSLIQTLGTAQVAENERGLCRHDRRVEEPAHGTSGDSQISWPSRLCR